MTRLSSDRTAALLTFVPALASLVMVLHHPVLRPEDARSGAALAAGIARIAAPNALFHGAILLLLGVQALGLASVAGRLGLGRMTVRAGVLFYGVATFLLFIPGTLDGFVTPLLGARCAGSLPACSASVAGALAFEWAAIQAFTRVALALQAIGLLCWSVALAQSPRLRWAGLAGALLAAAPLVLLGSMTHVIDPVRLGEIILFEALWAMAAAVMLWTGALAPPAEA